ncbi:class I SAM-dependent methyltransferase [Diaphorobacter sp. HDW4B]|uniref:class I SAM-dependent methyltransferase n=1 Tax=Diaphorobacter sp. HDW4B TaxID=2714925 RepID=UPI00140722EA|nr:class I SAM-dependent methyltransferase [Diaphorobacter sp. HDW4B]QIL70092.1 class I SAM-dependent methyltransferase [Diaphorobacter sp. HDW4B]
MEFDKYADSYSSDLKDAIPAGFRTIEYFSTYKVKLAKRFAPEKIHRILDFGCGVGQCSQYLAQSFSNAELVGFDVSDDSLDVARERIPQAHFTSAWDQAVEEKYDLIFTSNVFHHIDASEHALWLSRLKDALRPGGKIIIFEHNPINPLTRMVFKRCIFDQDAVMIGQKRFVNLAKSVGFSNFSTKYTLFFPGALKIFEPLERFIGWLPLGAQYYLLLQKTSD